MNRAKKFIASLLAALIAFSTLSVIALAAQIDVEKGSSVFETEMTIPEGASTFSFDITLKNPSQDFATLSYVLGYDPSKVNLSEVTYYDGFSGSKEKYTLYEDSDSVSIVVGLVNGGNVLNGMSLTGIKVCSLAFDIVGSIEGGTSVRVKDFQIVRVFALPNSDFTTTTEKGFNDYVIKLNGGGSGGGDNGGGGNGGGGNYVGGGDEDELPDGLGGSGNNSPSVPGGKLPPATTPPSVPSLIDLDEDAAPLGNVVINASTRTVKFRKNLNDVQFISGYGGNFRPDDNATRGELSQMIFNLSEKTVFSDLDKGAYHSEAIIFLTAHHVLSGYPDGSFKPDKNVTRAEVAAAIAYFIDETPEAASKAASVGAGGHWAAPYISKLVSAGIVSGDTAFKPNSAITRAECVVWFNRLLARDTSLSAVAMEKPVFKDVPMSHWAYKDIAVAAVR